MKRGECVKRCVTAAVKGHRLRDNSNVRAWPGFEPGTTRTLSEYHTPRPPGRQSKLLYSYRWLRVSVNVGAQCRQQAIGWHYLNCIEYAHVRRIHEHWRAPSSSAATASHATDNGPTRMRKPPACVSARHRIARLQSYSKHQKHNRMHATLPTSLSHRLR